MSVGLRISVKVQVDDDEVLLTRPLTTILLSPDPVIGTGGCAEGFGPGPFPLFLATPPTGAAVAAVLPVVGARRARPRPRLVVRRSLTMSSRD